MLFKSVFATVLLAFTVAAAPVAQQANGNDLMNSIEKGLQSIGSALGNGNDNGNGNGLNGNKDNGNGNEAGNGNQAGNGNDFGNGNEFNPGSGNNFLNFGDIDLPDLPALPEVPKNPACSQPVNQDGLINLRDPQTSQNGLVNVAPICV